MPNPSPFFRRRRQRWLDFDALVARLLLLAGRG